MGVEFRIVSWNCRRAPARSKLWDYLLDLDPHVALLQDFGSVPQQVTSKYTHVMNTAPRLTGHEGSSPRPVAPDVALHHMTGVLIKGTLVRDIPLPAPIEWVARELETFGEFFTAKEIRLRSGVTLKVLSVYSPAFPLDRVRMKDIDTSGIQLTQSRDVWATELLWSSLRSMGIGVEEPFIVAGDLNSSETLDHPDRRGIERSWTA